MPHCKGTPTNSPDALGTLKKLPVTDSCLLVSLLEF